MPAAVAYSASVLIPAYNASATIGDCLHSLCHQTGVDGALQIVVVDDASTDTTAEVVARYEQRADSERLSIELLRQPRRLGPASARNRCAAAAKADILLFTDADCVPRDDWVREMSKPFDNPEVAAVKGAYKTRQSALLARFAQAEFDSRYRKLARADSVDVVFTYAAGIRRSVFLDIGGFDQAFPIADNEDTDLSWRIDQLGHRIVFNPNAIVYHRHPATLTSYLGKKFRRAYWRAYVYRRFPKKALRDSYTPQTLKIQIGLVYLSALCLVLSPFMTGPLSVLVLLLAAFLATSVPFMRSLDLGDRPLWFAAPILVFARAGVMAAGLIAALPLLFKDVMQRGER